MEDFDRIMSMDFESPNLYENISCVKFWINRLDKFKSVERNCVEYCKLLDSTYKKFSIFVVSKSYDENLVAINAIHYYVYNKTIELIMERNTDDIESTEELHLLSNAFIELKDYSRALKSYEYLNTIEPYNSKTLSFIAMLYNILGDEKKCKLYIREALFYDPLSIEFENISIEIVVGPEFITGSSRMKSGTGQKMILNMISTVLMIKLGKIQGNSMVNMRLSNRKLMERGIRILQDKAGLTHDEARLLLQEYKNVSAVLERIKEMKQSPSKNKVS